MLREKDIYLVWYPSLINMSVEMVGYDYQLSKLIIVCVCVWDWEIDSTKRRTMWLEIHLHHPLHPRIPQKLFERSKGLGRILLAEI